MSPNDAQAKWDQKVDAVLRRVYRLATLYLVLGLGMYVPGSVLMLIFIPDKAVATLAVMVFFQVLVLIFGTRIIFPCIAGGFHVGLLANRESMPVFERVADALEGKDSVTAKLEQKFDQAVLDFREEAGKIREEVAKLGDGFNRPIKPLPPRQLIAEAMDGSDNGRSCCKGSASREA